MVIEFDWTELLWGVTLGACYLYGSIMVNQLALKRY